MGKAPRGSLDRFREARFGMFIHYGLYSLLGRHEWAMYSERIPFSEYRELRRRFRPRADAARHWVRLAQAAGMRYLCLTTRHHEGFALFDTRASGFNSANSPAGRDLVRDYVEACREAGMMVGLYYSVADWGDPGFVAGPKRAPREWKRFVDISHTQLRELMTNYGRIDYLFYDGCPPPATWRCAEINAEIRRLQPHILLSDRCALDEDVASAEGHTMGDPGKFWESCMTSNQSWGCNWGDSEWKTPREAIRTLLTCAHNGGNFLFNVGPKADGTVPVPATRLLRAVGGWLKRHGAAVYGTCPHPFNYADQKLSTGRGATAYVPLHFYHGPQTVIAGIGNRVLGVRILGTGKIVTFEQKDDRILLTGLPKRAPDPLMPVLEFELDGVPRGVPNPLSNAAKYEP